MCGIVGIIAKTGDVADDLLEGLKRLEYRGYDSAGLATLSNGLLLRRRAEGKLKNLGALLYQEPLPGRIGIGHTRWATHGAPTTANAHPHATDKVAVVHNGIIENFLELKAELQAAGHVFESQTDTEVVAHLLTDYLNKGVAPIAATEKTLKRLRGAFALALLFTGDENLLIGARRGSPLVVGYGDGAMYLGSDAIALSHLTQQICYLEDDDWVILTPLSAEIRDAKGKVVKRAISNSGLSGAVVGKGAHKHFMAKEIFEQPTVLGDTLLTVVDAASKAIKMPPLPFSWVDIRELRIVACGTSFHAGMVARTWFEQYAGLRVNLDIASEYRYRPFVDDAATLSLFISQSGETADTLAALRYAKEGGSKTLAIVNVPTSSMAREAGAVLHTHAGPEIGVASTKAFTTQLMVLAALAVSAGAARGRLDAKAQQAALRELLSVPDVVNQALGLAGAVEELADDIQHAQDVLYIGRGAHYAISLEGALKLKEISYIHAEGLAAGELKHGSIALIDENVPVIVLAPHDALYEKTISNLQEVIARKGKVLLLTDAAGAKAVGVQPWRTLILPDAGMLAAPILYTVPVQLLAYHVAVLKGTDVDQPRNLAKSVTVE